MNSMNYAYSDIMTLITPLPNRFSYHSIFWYMSLQISFNGVIAILKVNYRIYICMFEFVNGGNSLLFSKLL